MGDQKKIVEIDGQKVIIEKGHAERLEEQGRQLDYCPEEMGYDKDWRTFGGNQLAVKYINPLRGHIGYSVAGRNDLAAMRLAGITVTPEATRAGEGFDESHEYDIVIIHLSPEQYFEYMEEGKYHVARFVWEGDRLAPGQVWQLNRMDEVWVTDPLRVQQFKDSGVRVPIYTIPEVVKKPESSEYLDIPGSGYTFYSIFQWSERKDPYSLLRAYWREFGPEDNVRLVLKTYGGNFQEEEKKTIDSEIRQVKQGLGLNYYAPVHVFQNYMSEGQISALHEQGNCYVLPSRGEGWGIPYGVAALYQNPVIYTKCGGVTTWWPPQLGQEMVPVFGMSQVSWYSKDMRWVNVDEKSLRAKMRMVYKYPKEAAKEAQELYRIVRDKFNPLAVGKKFRERIKAIRGWING